ncbi:YfbR-like 5'-deoxynucleotidase [Georhizobium sp. MAB10]|uniref:YfbR-like 5'-deoxynucleotidase n=1 Tax=Georhizobium sp. MAB10 TaxID=3028319 RepID=UPI003855DADB
MLSGRRLDLIDPSPLDIEISDIAHGLARVARWNGQTIGRHAFSVAQHAVLVEEIATRINLTLDPATRMLVLLHDAPEYVIGDMISPFKAVLGGHYKEIEARLQSAIHLRFSLPSVPSAATKAIIKRADTIAAYFEATRLAGFSESEARLYFGTPRGVSPDMLSIEPLATEDAQTLFLERFAAAEAARRAEAG